MSIRHCLNVGLAMLLSTASYMKVIGEEPIEEKDSARDQIAVVFEHYRNCNEYDDSGVVECNYQIGIFDDAKAFKFATHFRRGRSFSFKSDPPAAYSVQLQDGVVRLEELGEFNKNAGDLWQSLKRISLGTQSASIYIPSLLLSAKGIASSLDEPERWVRVRSNTEDSPHHTEYEYSTTSYKYVFRVNREQKHIMRIVKTDKLFGLRTEISYDVAIDVVNAINPVSKSKAHESDGETER